MRRNSLPRRPSIRIPERIDVPTARLATLGNGVRLYLLENHDQQVVRLSFVFGAGSSRQTTLFSATSAANLLSEGSDRFTARQIAEQLDFYGSYFDIAVDRDVVVVSFCALSKFVMPTLQTAEEILLRPSFPQQEFDSYRIKRRQRLEIERRKVDVRVREAFAAAMFGADHPYGISAPEAAYDELTREAVVDFYRRHYTADNCFVVCSGDLSDEALAAIENICVQLPQSGDRRELVFPAMVQIPQVRLEHAGAVQSAVRVGRMLFTRNHPDYVGMQVVATVLGGYFGSRLMRNLREERGYTYGVFAGMVNLDRAGYLAIATQVAEAAREDTLHQIYTEIERLRTEPISEQELSLVKNIMVGEMMRILDGPFGIVDVTIENVQCGTDNHAVERTVEAIRRCTPEDVQRLAEKYLRREDLVEVTVG
ncbi:MAG: insulinase family protein [Rikenellaceae bacterium]|nr:insulinase family protein [Rikenellaceae bacterium]